MQMTIQFKVASTTYTVKSPEKQMEIEAYCAKITKRTGRTSTAADGFKAKHSSTRRDYPVFFAGMTTEDYVSRYAGLNARLCLKGWDHIHALGKAAPTLDPAYPEVVAEIEA